MDYYMVDYGGNMPFIRMDAGQPNCSPGNKPCGERCIPNDQECKKKGGGLMGKLAVGAGLAGAAYLATRPKKPLALGAAKTAGALPAAGGTGVKQPNWTLVTPDGKKIVKKGKRNRLQIL